MSQSQKPLDSNGRRQMVALRTTERVPPVGHRPQSSSEELFGREPFTSGRVPRYFGTGVPGYQGGPGFTGGYYGYGDESPEIPTELEREYADDLNGGGAARQPDPPLRSFPPATAAKVALDGTVPERWMKHAIEDVADACPGVQEVDNRIRTQSTPPRA